MKDGYAIEMRDVVKSFGEINAVDHVTIEIRNGEFFSMLGPSGCGKTTSLRMIAGFEYPTAGEIFLNGTPIASTPPFQRNVNTVFQSYALFPHMSVAENVAFGLEMKRVPRTPRRTTVQKLDPAAEPIGQVGRQHSTEGRVLCEDQSLVSIRQRIGEDLF